MYQSPEPSRNATLARLRSLFKEEKKDEAAPADHPALPIKVLPPKDKGQIQIQPTAQDISQLIELCFRTSAFGRREEHREGAQLLLSIFEAFRGQTLFSPEACFVATLAILGHEAKVLNVFYANGLLTYMGPRGWNQVRVSTVKFELEGLTLHFGRHETDPSLAPQNFPESVLLPLHPGSCSMVDSGALILHTTALGPRDLVLFPLGLSLSDAARLPPAPK
jgi:hypothetical protein